MIQGMNFDVASKEMSEHLTARVAFHAERAAFYKSQEANFASAPTADMSNDPVRGLKEAGSRHASKATLFSFMAAHVAVDEVYRLSQHELGTLEFI